MTVVPRSLGGRLALLLVLAITGAQAVAVLLFTHETTQLHRAAVRTRAAEQTETLARLVEALPPDLAATALAAHDTRLSRYGIGPESWLAAPSDDVDAGRLARHLQQRLGAEATDVRVALGPVDPEPQGAESGQAAGRQALSISTRLRDGRWLNSRSVLPDKEPSWMRIVPYQMLASLAAALLVVAQSRRSIVGPVAALAEAAGRIGRGEQVALRPGQGTAELRLLTAAFDEMQTRLRSFVADRTEMLAAIGHDLRTPIASLWLRAEMIEDPELRDAMVATIRDMREMVEATLAFARADAESRHTRSFDLADLTRTLVAERTVIDQHVTLRAPGTLPFHGNPSMLRRAIDNLVGNALRYGGAAEVTLAAEGGLITIAVEDRGPGIPEARLEEVFKPFARLEASRSDATGGVGLGLTIARSAARLHGGEVVLVNRPSGGLNAEIRLPVPFEDRSP